MLVVVLLLGQFPMPAYAAAAEPYNPCFMWPGANYINKKCILFVGNSSSRQDAMEACSEQNFGGNLLELRSRDDIEAFWKVFKDDLEAVWVGATYNPTLQAFLWESDRSLLPVDNSSGVWNVNQPDSPDKHNCVMMRPEGFHDNLCSGRIRSVYCELEIGDPCEKVDEDSVYIEGYCFTLINDKLNWDKALEDCKQRGSFLAELKTANLFKGIMNYLSTVQVSKERVYIGGSDAELENVFKWVTSDEIFSTQLYPFWSPNDPNDNEIIDKDEDYIAIHLSSTNSGLSDVPIDGFYPYLCQKELPSPCRLIYNGSENIELSCLKLFDVRITWKEALDLCKSDGAYLAEPKTKSFMLGVYEYLRTRIGQRVHIGGSDAEVEGTFKWVTSNETFKEELGTCWIGSDPNNLYNVQYREYENYVAIQVAEIDLKGDGILDVINNKQFLALCQKDIFGPHYEFVVVVPAMTSSTSMYTRKVYVTTGSNFVMLKIVTTTATKQKQDFRYITSTMPYVLEIDSKYELSYAGVYDKHIVIHSWGSVSVVYVSMATEDAESTLIYPNTLTLGEAERGKVYFVPSFSLLGNSGNQLAVVAMENEDNNVSVDFRFSDYGAALKVDGFLYRNVTTSDVALEQLYQTAFIEYLDVDMALVQATVPVSVVMATTHAESSTSEPDFFIESILPIEFIDTEYVTFPSFSGPLCYDVFQLVPVYDNTTIQVYELNETKTVHLQDAGVVYHLELTCETSYYLQGNQPFYVYKLSTTDTVNRPCVTSLMPRSVWRSQYDVTVPSEFTGYDIRVHVITKTDIDPSVIVTPDTLAPSNCSQVLGTIFMWCHYKIPSDNLEPPATFHLSHTSTFGAYMYSVGPHSAVCHSLGVNEEAVPTHKFDPLNLLAKLETQQKQVNLIKICETDTALQTSTSDASAVSMTTTQDPTISCNLTQEELRILLDKIHDDLRVNRRNTSAYRRTLISVPNESLSAQEIGSVGVAIVACVVILMMVPDICSFFRKLFSFGKNRKER